MHQPLFFNPNVVYNGKTLYFEFFVTAGLVRVSDICFEAVPRFFSREAIIEIVNNTIPDKPHPIISCAIDVIFKSLPDNWKKN